MPTIFCRYEIEPNFMMPMRQNEIPAMLVSMAMIPLPQTSVFFTGGWGLWTLDNSGRKKEQCRVGHNAPSLPV